MSNIFPTQVDAHNLRVSVRFEHKCDNKRTLTMDSEKFTELVRDYTPLYDQPSKHMMIMSKKKKKIETEAT